MPIVPLLSIIDDSFRLLAEQTNTAALSQGDVAAEMQELRKTMVHQQQTDEIDAFIRSLREKALERHRRSSAVETRLEEANRRLAEHQRMMTRLAQMPAGSPPSRSTPPGAGSLAAARRAREEFARSSMSLIEELKSEPQDVARSEMALAIDTDVGTSLECVAETDADPIEANAGLPDACEMQCDGEVDGTPEDRTDGIAFGRLDEMAPPPETPSEPEAFLEQEPDCLTLEAPPPGPGAAGDCIAADDYAEQAAEAPPARPARRIFGSVLPLKKLVLPKLPPPSEDLVVLPDLDDEAEEEYPMIAAAQEGARANHGRAATASRPLPKFATMSAYEEAEDDEAIDAMDAPAEPRVKVTMTRSNKRSFWRFGGKQE